MKKTALHNVHVSLGARMVPFAGYDMPVSYEGVNAEHMTVRKGVGVFDVSHMGEFFVRGEQALDLLQWCTTNDVSKIAVGGAQYNCMPNATGGIVDDLIIYRTGDQEYLLVVNASNMEKDWKHLNEQLEAKGYDAQLENQSDNWSLLAIQGPKAAEAMQSLTDVDLSSQKYYTFSQGKFAGADNVIISATGYTGSGGFEIYVPNESAEHVWNEVFRAGADWGIKPIGLAARDTLRLEKGYALYGNDLSDSTSPLEAGLGWITKFKKGDFLSRELLQEQKKNGVNRKLVGFVMQERGIPRHDYRLLNQAGEPVGVVTSGTMSPMLEQGIGMAYVDTAFSSPDTPLLLEVRRKQIPAVVQRPPFVA